MKNKILPKTSKEIVDNLTLFQCLTLEYWNIFFPQKVTKFFENIAKGMHIKVSFAIAKKEN